MRRFIAIVVATLSASLGMLALTAPAAFAKPACFCRCDKAYDPLPRWSDFTAGNQDCRNDCVQACDGAENLESSTSTGKLYSNVACVPGKASDCKTGGFSVYEGTTCQLQLGAASQRTADMVAFPDTGGKKPTCVVPITMRNANIECGSYSGLGAGATCGIIEGGTDPNAYDKSRSTFGGPATAAGKYTGSYTYAQWQTLFRPIPAYDALPATAGVCQRYGLLHGAGQTYDQGNTEPTVGDGLLPDAPPTNEMVCLKRKQNQCGRVDRPNQPNTTVPLNGNAYSCQRTADVTARGQSVSTACWGSHEQLCGGSSDPGVLCCLGGTAGTGMCYTNADCGTGKVCTNGACVVNVVCDPTHVDRRCRSAAEQERVNSDICTLPVLTSSPANCPMAGQTCCKAPNPQALSSCASDLVTLANGDTRFNDFACLPASELTSQVDPLTGTIKTFSPDTGLSVTGGATSWQSYSPTGAGPHCLGGTIVKRDAQGHVTGTVPRCGGTSVCCNARAVASPSQTALQAARRPVGSACGSSQNQGSGFRCMDINSVIPTDDVALQRFGMSRDQYLVHLAASGNCQITPYDANVMYSTKECVANAFCCSPRTALSNVTTCRDDSQCPSGTKCELSVHACLDANIVGASRTSPSCFTQASSDTDGAAVLLQNIASTNNVTTDQFSCQLIDRDAAGTNSKCVPAGCSSYPVPAGEPQGTTSQCCIPGVGRSPGAAAQKGTPKPAPPAYSIPLPACIKTGDCTLDDIVATGAGFANFLISISGAVFLAIFVYGGFLYLTAGTSDRAEKGKKMIVQATKGMVLLMSAFVIVNFIQRSLISGPQSATQADACVAKSNAKTSYQCGFLSAPATDAKAVSEESAQRGCQAGLCGANAPKNYLCCPI